MNNYLISVTDFALKSLSILWLPLAIWTVISLCIWIFIKSSSRLHPQYHYHTRLALLLSLPTGFLSLLVIWGLESMLMWGGSEPYDITFITVMSPIEVSVSSTTVFSLSWIELFVLSVVTIFFIGVVVTLSNFLVKYVRLRKVRMLYHTALIETYEHLEDQNIYLAKQTGRKISYAFVQTDIVPVTFGYRKPVILLPSSLKESPEKCNLALRHELTHISQNDFISHILAVITQSLFWFHPLVHQLKRELIEYRELRCDSILLSEGSVSRKKYASLLLELLPMPNINKELSVNMAQESSNLKKRIEMITKIKPNKTTPSTSSMMIFGILILSTVVAMACTDMQTENIFDDEELNLMTDIDQTGERGYHQVIIFMGDDQQDERNQETMDKLNLIPPSHVQRIDVLKGKNATEAYGERGKHGVILIQIEPGNYAETLQLLGMEDVEVPPIPPSPTELPNNSDNHFVVVEQMPELIGGLESVQMKIRYPEEARSAGIEGRVYVQFIVDEDGNVDNPKVVRGIGGGADEEALRVVSQAKFKPGMQKGRTVRVQYSLPIHFKLTTEKTTQ